jgi:predicted RNase H-like HicB family nuclease
MREYFAVIIQDENMNFDATFPDLPGCFASGATFEEARAAASEVLGAHLAVMERHHRRIPAPSPLETIVGGEDSHCGAAILVQETRDGVDPAP